MTSEVDSTRSLPKRAVSHYRQMRLQMQIFGIIVACIVATVEVAINSGLTLPSLAVLSGVPLCAMLYMWLDKKDDARDSSFVLQFDTFCIAASVIFDVFAAVALRRQNSGLYQHCVAYLTPAWVLPQIVQVNHCRFFCIAHGVCCIALFGFDCSHCVPFMLHVVLMSVGHVNLSRELCRIVQEEEGDKICAMRQAENFIREIMSGFCDACATLSSDLNFLHLSTSLGALTSRATLVDKPFNDLVIEEDRQEFSNRCRQQQDKLIDGEHIALGDGNTVCLQSFRIDLQDAYCLSIPVHIFLATLKVKEEQLVHIVGVSEMWRPKQNFEDVTRSLPPSSSFPDASKSSPGLRQRVATFSKRGSLDARNMLLSKAVSFHDQFLSQQRATHSSQDSCEEQSTSSGDSMQVLVHSREDAIT